MSIVRRFLGSTLCFACILLAAVNAKAAAPRKTQCLKDRYDINKALDIFSIQSGGNSIAANDTSGTVQVGSVLDYFCRPGRVLPLSRWPADPDIVSRADSILHNKYKFWIHEQLELPEDPSWSENPDDNRNWVYHLHSFDFLWILTEAFRMTGNTGYLARGLELVLDYIDDNCNPSKLTCALSWSDQTAANRMIFLTDCWPLLVENGLMSRNVASRLLEFIWRHGRFLDEESNYAGWSNHGIFSSVGLLRIAVFFPEFRESSKWKATAIDRMENQLKDNFSSSGVHKEFGPWYQIWCAAVISKYIEDCEIAGIELSPEFLNKYLKIAEAAPCFIYPDNTISLAGDSGLEPNEILMRSFLAENERKSEEKTLYCRETGVFIMRNEPKRSVNPENGSCLMAFFSGKARDHNHVDPLNIELYSRGQKWITDSGRFAYEPDAIQRKYVLSQRAHNTVIPVISRNVVEPGERGRTRSAVAAKPPVIGQVAVSEASSLPATASRNLIELRNEFIENNPDILSSIDSDVPDREQKLGILFDRINGIDDPGLKIEILMHMEGNSTGILLEKIFVMIAMCYMEINSNPAAKEYLDKIVESGSDSDYYDIAVQLIGTLDVEYEGEPDRPSSPDPTETDQQPVNPPMNRQEKLVKENSGTGDGRMEGDSFNQPLIHDDSKPDILTWMSKRKFDYLEGFLGYNNKLSHSRAVLFVKPYYFIIVDRVDIRQSVRIEQVFHFPPEVAVKDLGDGKWLLSSHDSVYCLIIPLITPGGIDTEIVKGQTKPFYQGWYSGRYKELLPAPAMVNRCDSLAGINYLAYLMIPTGTRNPARTRIRSTHPDVWDGNNDKPIRVWINDPAYMTTLSFKPSDSFILGDKNASGAPVINIRRFRN